MEKVKESNKKLVYSALFLATGIILPLFTAQIKHIGNMLLPMHIPVLICGFICGWKYGMAIGFLLPIIRGLIFGMPPLFPNSVWMAFELLTYGFMTGFLYPKYKKEKIWWIYLCLVISMISGRIVWAAVKTILLGVNGGIFTFEAFMAGGILNAVPGILIQLILIPAIMVAVNKKQNNS